MTGQTEGQERVAALQGLRQVVESAATPVNVPDEILRWTHEWDRTKTGAVINAVVVVHRHKLMDEHVHFTDDLSKAKYAQCDSCGNLPNGFLWCPTIRVIAAQLGLSS